MTKNIKVWRCPNCTKKSILININKINLVAKISCGSCGFLINKVINRISEPVDVYGDFIDEYYEDSSILFEKNKSETNSIPPEITTEKIIKTLLIGWKNINQLCEELNIESDLDTRYLKIKLKLLEKNGKLEIKRIGDKVFWRKVKKGIVL